MSEAERVEVELDREAIEAAAAAGLDLSQVLLEALRRRLPDLHAREGDQAAHEWYKENKAAVDWYNRFIEEHGLFSDGVRMF